MLKLIVSVIASNYVFAKEAIKIRQWYLKNKVEKLKDGLYPVLVSGLPNERGTELTMADLAANNVDDVDDVYMLKSAIEIETFTEMRDIVQEKLENALTSVARDEFKYRKDNPEKNDFSIRSDRLREISVLAESIVDINTDIKTEIDNLYAQQNTMSAVISHAIYRFLFSCNQLEESKCHLSRASDKKTHWNYCLCAFDPILVYPNKFCIWTGFPV
ncbi:hypothetical protein AX774_g4947 [Zancudomyces culisetae]|uniref:Uncharacterized protein n=1 Tax=Zancudomyces culisetae TaxID=1213189 RepID=A0A1R1PL39_ZANCU|nr:hypothetical protein AX774_g4947 [Zancudomyces culisetae]|eukprot:OMH81592.1 hypothetical protein AX774_g4947 [Zancudomyces culisetae]